MTDKLLPLSGSIRKSSCNTATLQNLADYVNDGITIDIFPLSDVTLYNEDIGGAETPRSVVGLHSSIGATDGVIIASPEYN
ncbi:NAD(P)H-dependent oxidoreductase [Brenneria populi subsp. brevivirga]|uniref:NADPH-dependent FMN reductase n=1 Tax=Brenneria populi TaxID=1505588 RepID=UPI002E16E49C|nr:NAD(P)H-dependent oxidoreductase [Brenneria populi subsp. brevivirga]